MSAAPKAPREIFWTSSSSSSGNRSGLRPAWSTASSSSSVQKIEQGRDTRREEKGVMWRRGRSSQRGEVIEMSGSGCHGELPDEGWKRSVFVVRRRLEAVSSWPLRPSLTGLSGCCVAGDVVLKMKQMVSWESKGKCCSGSLGTQTERSIDTRHVA